MPYKYRCSNRNCRNFNGFESERLRRDCPIDGYSVILINEDDDNGGFSLKEWIVKNKKVIWIVLCILLVIVAAFFFLRCCDEKEFDIVVKMEYDDSNNGLGFMVEGVSSENLKDYKINVYDEKNTIYEIISFDGHVNNILYKDEKMADGKWYYFYLERIDGDSIKKMKWNKGEVETIRYHLKVDNDCGHFRLKGVGEGIPKDDTINDGNLRCFKTISCHPKPICSTKKYEIKVEEEGSDMSEYIDLKFEVEGKVYSCNPFYISAPNQSKEMEIKVSASNVGSPITVSVILDPIENNLPAPFSKNEAQNIINEVSNGKMWPDEAQSKLAKGDVKLKRSIDGGNITTLWDVLDKAEDGYYFTIKSFEIDNNTNKIKSGTLEVEMKK